MLFLSPRLDIDTNFSLLTHTGLRVEENIISRTALSRRNLCGVASVRYGDTLPVPVDIVDRDTLGIVVLAGRDFGEEWHAIPPLSVALAASRGFLPPG